MIEEQVAVFWSRFWKEYVPTLRKVTRWVRGEDEPEVGQMVLVLDKEFEGQVKWPLARITGLKRDCAGKAQTVEILFRGHLTTRGIRGLAPLPLVHDE